MKIYQVHDWNEDDGDGFGPVYDHAAPAIAELLATTSKPGHDPFVWTHDGDPRGTHELGRPVYVATLIDPNSDQEDDVVSRLTVVELDVLTTFDPR